MRRLLCFMMLTASMSLFAQSEKEMRKTADKHFKAGEYTEAWPLYKKLINLEPTNSTYTFKYGSCIVMINKNNAEALKFLLQAEKSGKPDKEIAFFIGKAYQNNGEYDSAIEYYERFLDAAEGKEAKKLKVKQAIKTCKKMAD